MMALYNSAGVESFLRRVFAELDHAGVEYAVMRNYRELPHRLGGSDLDILVCSPNISLLESSLWQVVLDCGGCFIGSSRSPGFMKSVVFGRAGSKGEWWGARLDISFGLAFAGCAKLIDIRSVSAFTAHHKGISVFSDEVAHVLGVAKELLHNAEFPDRYAAGAAEAFRANPELIERAFRPMGPKANSILRALCLGGRGHSSLKRSCGELRRAVLMHAFWKAPFSFVLRRLIHEMSKVRRFLWPPGLVLAVLGADGAGKSTVIDAIAPVLDQATHGAFYRRHLRPGLLSALGRLRGARTASGPVTDPHGSAPAGWIGSAVRLVWLWLDYVLGYWLVVRPKIATSPAVVLFDRYAHDVALDPRRFRLGLPKPLLRLFPRLVPSPALLICLHGDPEIVAARKGELSIEEVRRQTEALKELAASTPNAILVSTEGSVEETRDAVLCALRSFLLERNSEGR